MGSDSLMGHFAVGGRTAHHTVGAESMRAVFPGAILTEGLRVFSWGLTWTYGAPRSL